MTILPKEILVPTDFSESSKVALAWATGLCDGCSASLHLLHVLETVTVADPVDVPFDSRMQLTQAIERPRGTTFEVCCPMKIANGST